MFREKNNSMSHEIIDKNTRDAIVLVHGGIWFAGSPNNLTTLANQLSERCQMTVMVPSYDLTQLKVRVFYILSMIIFTICISLAIIMHSTTARLVAIVIAIIAVSITVTLSDIIGTNGDTHPVHVKCLAKRIDDFKMTHSIDNIHLVGHSAGGALAALLAVTSHWRDNRDILSLTCISTPMSSVPMPNIMSWILSRTIFAKNPLVMRDGAHEAFAWPLTSVEFIHRNFIPPTFLLCAELEIPGILKGNETFAMLLREQGVVVRERRYHNETHVTIRTGGNHLITNDIVDFIKST
jgi:acetyl esterase/lipase